MHIHYLLTVHQYDYYGGVEAPSPEEFLHKLTLHFRRMPSESQFKSQPGDIPKKLEVRVELRINRPLEGTDPSFVKLGGKSLERVVDTFLSDYVKKETDAKHRCTVCQKLFKGDEFVKKHLKTKHPETSSDITSETLLFNAYMLDPNRVDPLKAGPSPVQQPSSTQGRQFAQPRSRVPFNRNQDSRPPPPGHA